MHACMQLFCVINLDSCQTLSQVLMQLATPMKQLQQPNYSPVAQL